MLILAQIFVDVRLNEFWLIRDVQVSSSIASLHMLHVTLVASSLVIGMRSVAVVVIDVIAPSIWVTSCVPNASSGFSRVTTRPFPLVFLSIERSSV